MSARGISEDSFLQFVLEKLEVLPPGGLTNPKRYAIYLPSSRRSYTDALFTSETRVDSWDLTRSESTGSLYSRSSARPSMRESLAWLATDLSPASLPFVPKSLDSSKSAETSSTLSASSETYTPTSYTCLVEQDLRVRYTPSSHGALLDAVRCSCSIAFSSNQVQSMKKLLSLIGTVSLRKKRAFTARAPGATIGYGTSGL